MVLNSTRRRISRRTAHISTMAKVMAPRQRRLRRRTATRWSGSKWRQPSDQGRGSGYSCALAYQPDRWEPADPGRQPVTSPPPR